MHTHLDFNLSSSKVAIAEYLQKSKAHLEEAFLNGSSGVSLNSLVTEQYDRVVRSLFKRFSHVDGDICLIALGGYGRCEMSPCSDVDLLLLYQGIGDEAVKDLINRITYPLWDCGVEVCGVTRTIRDCRKVASQDTRSLTSMMDARFLIGNAELYERFQTKLSAYISRRRFQNRYIRAKLDEYERRLKRYGDSVFVSEPHVKEGEGGLRCYHTSLWLSRLRYGVRTFDDLLAKGLVDQKNNEELKDALDFLWRVRHGLHLIAGRKQDRLDYDLQETLSARMGFESENARASLEEFMHNFYRRASYVHQFSERLVNSSLSHGLLKRVRNRLISKKLDEYIYRLGDVIYISSRVKLEHHPDIAMKAWHRAHQLKLRMDRRSKEAIRSASFFWGDSIAQKDVQMCELFKELIKDPVQLDRVLIEMHETGVLTKIFPEFERLYHKVQYDVYHIYTVDIHTIFLIRELSKLALGIYEKEFPYFTQAYRGVTRPDLLVMAGLLHDIGKGYGGRERHDHLGAQMAEEIMKRFGYGGQDQELVKFLVKSHLVLPQVAFCRDTSDPSLIENLASAVKTTDNLLLLYILTFADIRATGPELWTTWKGELLTSLYSRTLDFLAGRGFTSQNVAEVIEKKVREMEDFVEEREYKPLAEWMSAMPARYVLNTHPSKIAAHFIAKQELNYELLKMDVGTSSDQIYNNMTIVTHDSPGLFSRMCRVLSANSISILEAQLYTDKDGHVVDLLKVVSKSGRKIRGNFDWDGIRRELRDAVLNKAESNDQLIAAQKRFLPTTNDQRQTTRIRRRRQAHRPEVLIDNDVSAYYTVLEIHAPDEVGLLYKVANWLYTHGYDIFMAKVTTHVGQAIDVFYIKNFEGKKVESKGEISQIKMGLVNCLTA